MVKDPLRVRLFGYGVPYRARFDADGVVREAVDLARELRALTGVSVEEAESADGVWAVSVPFGRCGVHGLPCEHLVVHHAEEAYVDVLGAQGFSENAVQQGKMVHVVPGAVIRLRARPLPGRRVLVGFQTEDRTPLIGNAAPFTLDGEVPDAYDERLIKAHGTFDQVKSQAQADPQACAEALHGFFDAMAQRIAGDAEIAEVQARARDEGSYDVEDEMALCQRQRDLLRADVLERIENRDRDLFRFPGMFGGITTLFNAVR